MEIKDLIVGARYHVSCPGNANEGYEGGAVYKGLAKDLFKNMKYAPGTIVFECDDGEEGCFGIEDVRWEIARWGSEPAAGPDLKQVLMELGNAMVQNHDFGPAIGDRHGSMGYNTEPIRCFTEWMNNHPHARDELKKLGFNWSM